MITLNLLKKSEAGRIVAVRSGCGLTNRLMSMGMLPGVFVQVVGVAPLGDPMLVQIDGCRLSLRRDEAEALTVEPDPVGA